MNIDHIFLDPALTSTDPEKGEVIALAVARTDHRGTVRTVDGVRAAYSERIRTEKEIDAESRELTEAVRAMRELVCHPSFDDKFVIVAHGNLDRAFLRKAWQKAGEKGEVFGARLWLDAAQVAWPLAYSDQVSSSDLTSLASTFGFTNSAPDTCTGDCELLMKTYWAMMRRYRLALVGEGAVRDVVGEGVSGFLGKLGSLFNT